MFRTTAVRSLPRSFATGQAPNPRATLYNHVLKASLRTSARPIRPSKVLALAVAQTSQKSIVRYESNAAKIWAQYDAKKVEEESRNQTLQPVPEIVSSSSSVRPLTGEVKEAEHEEDVDMMAGIRSDFVRSCPHEDTTSY